MDGELIRSILFGSPTTSSPHPTTPQSFQQPDGSERGGGPCIRGMEGGGGGGLARRQLKDWPLFCKVMFDRQPHGFF